MKIDLERGCPESARKLLTYLFTEDDDGGADEKRVRDAIMAAPAANSPVETDYLNAKVTVEVRQLQTSVRIISKPDNQSGWELTASQVPGGSVSIPAPDRSDWKVLFEGDCGTFDQWATKAGAMLFLSGKFD